MKKFTIFCDIDGTILKYRKFETYMNTDPEPINNVIDELKAKFDEGHCIVLTSARPEYLRYHTMKELSQFNVPFHQLVLGLQRGTRFLINDKEDDSVDRAIGINVSRDNGFSEEDIKKMEFPTQD